MAQQPAPSAAAFDEHGFRDWVLRNLPKGSIIGNGEWWADHLTAWAKRFVKAAPQPSPTPQADSQPAPVLDSLLNIVINHEALATPAEVRSMAAELATYRAASTPADSVTAPAGGATGKNLLQVQAWVIPDGNGGGQFSWQKQDERYWTRLTPPAQAADSVLEDAGLSGEQQRAIFETYESAASESYFEVSPQIDCNDRRRVFKAGYERGWDAARKQGGA